ncbi:MAG TPA: hypothetical protein VME92_05955 [Acetobacteraceae bacterium]|nr:hypothetical protein [Acetobacteraceae bacterium]
MAFVRPAFADAPAPAFTLFHLATIREWHFRLPPHLRARVAVEHEYAEEILEIRADDGAIIAALTRGPAGTFVAEDLWDRWAAPQLVRQLDEALDWIQEVLTSSGWMEGRPECRPGADFAEH